MLSRDNIQRVRRDEAEAKAKEEEKQKRAEIAVSAQCHMYKSMWMILKYGIILSTK